MFKWLKEWGEEVKDKFQVVVPGYFGGDWVTDGLLTDPVSGTILSDTDCLPAGIYEIRLWTGGSVNLAATYLSFELRNAANDTTLKSHRFGTFANDLNLRNLGLLKILEGQRLRVIVTLDITGKVQVSILYVRVFPLKRGQ